MTLPNLTPDCQNCDALCCVLLAFDRSRAFAFTKPACTPCGHLADDNLCRIHPDLESKGFKGCIRFDCHGAGQMITQTVFKDRSWRDDPTLMPTMTDAFRTLRRLHETAVLLDQAADLPLTPAQHSTRQTLRAALDLHRDWTETSLHALAEGPLFKSVTGFFTSLRGAVTVPRR